MNTFQKVIKNIVTAVLVTVAICLLALIIELGISVSQWLHGSHHFSLPWSSSKEEVAEEDSVTAYPDVKKLSVSCSTYDLEIRTEPGIDAIQVSYESNDGNVSVGTDKETLVIRQKKSYNIFNWFKNKDKIQSPGTIYVQVPRDYSLDDLELSLGDGDTTIGKIFTRHCSLESSDGAFTSTGTHMEQADFTTGDGTCRFEDVQFDQVSLQGGAGEVSITGTISTSGDFAVDDGDFTLLLNSPMDYYGIDIDRGDGQITINGENYESVPLDSKGVHTIKLENEDGNCNLIFQENEKKNGREQ